mgnify:CR=1 FL=1
MRVYLLLGLMMVGQPMAWAGTVCRVISTGQVAESYSATQPDGLCVSNLVSSGIAANDIEQLTVTAAQRKTHLATWDNSPNNPDVDKRQQLKDTKTAQVNLIKQKLGLTDAELEALRATVR